VTGCDLMVITRRYAEGPFVQMLPGSLGNIPFPSVGQNTYPMRVFDPLLLEASQGDLSSFYGLLWERRRGGR
jgi:hypothetical protein